MASNPPSEEGAQSPENFPLSLARIDIGAAIGRQYIGLPTDAESRRLVRKFFYITREVEALIDRLVQDPRTDYGQFSDFVRHAVHELLYAYYSELGYPDADIGKELDYEASIRSQSYRASRRADLREMIHRYDDELEEAITNIDWKYISEHLDMLDSWLKEAPTLQMEQAIGGLIFQTPGIKRAIEALEKWSVSEDRQLPKSVKEQAKRWEGWLESWVE